MSRKGGGRKRPSSRTLDDGLSSFDDLDEEFYARRVSSLRRFKRTFDNIIEKYSSLAIQSEGESGEVIDTLDLGDPGEAYDVSAIDDDTSWKCKAYDIRDLDDFSLDDETAHRHIVPVNSTPSSVRFDDEILDHLFQEPQGKFDSIRPRTSKLVHGKRWTMTPIKNRDVRTVTIEKIRTKERDRDDVCSTVLLNGDSKDRHYNSPESRGAIQNTGIKRSPSDDDDKHQWLVDGSSYDELDDIKNDVVVLFEDDSDEDGENVLGSVVAPIGPHSISDDEYRSASSSISR